ncbi:MAG: hypothetical protein IKV40_05795 [Clostridia bacterium]|nr:hypothetical protein [Clostridia bacterium]
MRSEGKQNNQFYITSAILALAVCVGMMFVGFLYSKYVKELNFSGKVTISANLAQGFEMYEHEVAQNSDGTYANVTQNSDGSYKISGEITDENEYRVLPGIDIPKDPTISIKGKSGIPAYLFIEVVDRLDHSIINYDLAEYWREVAGAKPQNGGKVYVYIVDGTPGWLTNETIGSTFEVSIIKGNKLTVSSNTRDENGNEISFYSTTGAVGVDLDFHAYLLQADSTNVTDAAAVFNKLVATATVTTETTAVTETP